jgi:peptidyl-prolyl cis-trans isomerase C
MEIDPAEVYAQLQMFKDQLGTEEAFLRYLEEKKQTVEEARRFVEDNLLAQKYLEIIAGKAAVGEAEIRKFYDENPDRFREGERMRASWILIRCTPEDPEEMRENARKRIEEVQARLQDGADFAELAKEYSQTNSAPKGGDIGFFPKGVMVKPFEEAAFSLEPGEVSPIFETQFGYNIVKATGYKEPSIIPFEEVKPTIALQLTEKAAGGLIAEKINELQKVANIEIPDTPMFPMEPEGEAGAQAGEQEVSTP